MAFVDFHVHIDYYKNYYDIFRKYEELHIYTLFVTNLPQIYAKCIQEFHKSDYIRIALGYNPQLSNQYDFDKRLFEKHIDTTKYIGEVGLDFSSQYVKTKDKQLEVFNYICEIAGKKNKIMSIHSRKADEPIVSILENKNIKFAVFHWYTGSIERIEQIIDDGYYFSANLAMLKSNSGREILKKIPINRLLIETDGPHTYIKKSVAVPEKMQIVYNEFGKFFNMPDLSEIIYSNFKKLLMDHNHERV